MMQLVKYGLVVGMLTSPFVAAHARGDDPFDKDIQHARTLFKHIVDEDYDAFVAACDDTMKAALPAEKLQEIWTGLVDQIGAYEGERRATAAKEGAYTVVNIVARFSSRSMNVRIALRADGKAAGLFFTPSAEGATYAPPDYVNQAKFREEEVTVSAGRFALSGTLTLPKGTGPFRAVVLVHGSGPQDRDETIHVRKPFKDIAWGLASRGVAILRYEKRTFAHGESMNPVTITIDEETVDDAVAAAHLLMKRDDIDPARVFLVGHSLGATAAPYAARKEPRLAGLVLLAPAASSIYELALMQAEYISAVDGTIDDTERKLIEETRKSVEALRGGTWHPGDMLFGAPVEYWSMLDKLAPVAIAKTLNLPMLIVQGGRDYQVPPRTEFAAWKKGLAGRPNVTLRLLDKLDHLLVAGDGPSTPGQYETPGHVDDRVIELIADWVASR